MVIKVHHLNLELKACEGVMERYQQRQQEDDIGYKLHAERRVSLNEFLDKTKQQNSHSCHAVPL